MKKEKAFRDGDRKPRDKKSAKKRPLNRRILLVCSVFFILLSFILSAAVFGIYSSTMYGRYQKQMASILDYVEAHIDHDDMAQCAKTYVESEKYKEFRVFFDEFFDYYTDVHYLYIMQVLDPGEPVEIRSICSANSTEEKENDPDMVLYLGDGEEDWYSKETAQQFREILQGGKDVYFTNPSEWGVDYTLARPVKTSAGEYYGLLCADVSVDELNAVIYRSIYISIGVIILSGVILILLLQLWLRVNVTRPLKQLEKSVTDYAESSSGKRDPDELRYTPPDLRTRDEVQSVSDAVMKLSEDMRDYVKGMLAAENEKMGMQAHVTEMSEIAYRDALTRVKNKAAYDDAEEELNRENEDGEVQFGIVMMDINGLKKINDRYGHEHGNEYIVGCCGLLCRTFKHSPVYRIGGDEFVAVIRDGDYRDREKLLCDLRDEFAAFSGLENAQPWERYSAAVGMAAAEPGDDVETVFNRADADMYEEKQKMNAAARQGQGKETT